MEEQCRLRWEKSNVQKYEANKRTKDMKHMEKDKQLNPGKPIKRVIRRPYLLKLQEDNNRIQSSYKSSTMFPTQQPKEQKHMDCSQEEIANRLWMSPAPDEGRV
ncbi:hypothetical protein STEG23_014736 [Scotinomys teguina]